LPEETRDPGLIAPDTTPEIPDKIYFRIGEVARLAGVAPYVLRYWETEFPEIAPKKFGTNHRQYRRKDVEMVLEIKRLLYDRRFTIEGARKHLISRKRTETKPKVQPAQSDLFGTGKSPLLKEIRRELEEILRILR
jgi:DNA-binding transcriptional MerR regulator